MNGSILDQDEVWIDRAGRAHRLVDMDRHHRANLIPMLRRLAPHLQFQAFMADRHVWPDDPSDGVWAAMLAQDAAFEEEPDEWIARKPLMRKLLELEAGRSFADRKVTAVRNKAYELATGYRKVGER